MTGLFAFMQPLDNVLALILALTIAAAGAGVLAFAWPRGGERDAARVKRQSWAIGAVAVVTCLVCLGVFFVLLELLAAASTS
jgi:protein-S-isoprenylcysteine O-methyltransferase Ste14